MSACLILLMKRERGGGGSGKLLLYGETKTPVVLWSPASDP